MQSKLFLTLSLMTVAFSSVHAFKLNIAKTACKNAVVVYGNKALWASSVASIIWTAYDLANAEAPEVHVVPMTKWEKVKASAQNAKTYVSDKAVKGFNVAKTSAKTGYTFAANHPKSSAVVATAVIAGLGYAAYSYYNSNNAVVVSAPEVQQEEVKAPAVRTGGPARRAVRKAVQA